MFKDRHMKSLYETCRRLGADTTSELYYKGLPRRGASHRVAYWVGRAGEDKPNYIGRNSLSYACFKAGRDDRKADERKGNAMPPWNRMQMGYAIPPEGWEPR